MYSIYSTWIFRKKVIIEKIKNKTFLNVKNYLFEVQRKEFLINREC